MLLRSCCIWFGLLVIPGGLALSQTQLQTQLQTQSQTPSPSQTPSQALAADLTTAAEQLILAEDGLSLLETQFGNHDPRLIEALDQLAEEYIARGQFDAAHVTLDRAAQITRLAEGLFTPAQLPFLQKKIANYAQRGDWQSANEQAEHLLWLYREKAPLGDDLISGLMALAELHLRAVVEDLPEQQAFHFMRAMTANRLALVVAQEVWDERDSRIADLNYELLKQHYLQTVAIDEGSEASFALREMAPGSGWAHDRETARRQHYFGGLALLHRIREVYNPYEGETPADAEARAMVDLYTGDWQVLFTRRDDALVNYDAAYAGLLEAGLTAAQVDAYLEVPEVLPVTEFFASIASAQDARTAVPAVPVPGAPVTNSLALQFNAWSPAFPNVQAPAAFSRRNSQDPDYALFSFSLTGLSEISHWVRGTYRTGIGVVDRIELLETRMDLADDESELLNNMRTMRFRPPLINGAPADAIGTFRYIVTN